MKNIDIINIINVIIGEEVEYQIRSESLIFLNIFDELLEIHSDTEHGEYFANNPYPLTTLQEIFNYILIRVVLVKGWSKELLQFFGTEEILRDADRKHLERIASNRSVSPTQVFMAICKSIDSPENVHHLINEIYPVTAYAETHLEMLKLREVSHKLAKATRAKNRKFIISKITNQVLNSKE